VLCMKQLPQRHCKVILLEHHIRRNDPGGLLGQPPPKGMYPEPDTKGYRIG
jgi:hypothetical protein